MSLVFNDTTTYRGLVQVYEKELGFSYGDISADTTKLKTFAADANLALDDFIALAIQADGRWQFDDSNQTDYPIITTNLVVGQRDYNFVTDHSGNLILDVFKVFAASPSGIFQELLPVDVESDDALPLTGTASGQLYTAGTDSFTNGQNAQGTPTRYDKLANAVFLDPIPSYNATGGLKVYVNREASYFSYTDTTKKAGIPGLFHRYLAILPAYRYAASKSMPVAGGRLRNGAFTGLLMEIKDIENSVQAYFSRRNKDERARLTTSRDSNR